MSEAILKVEELTTHLRLGNSTYAVVDHLSFDLFRGKTLALVGESGCGKSMCALSLMRILPQPPALPSTGRVLYRGENLLTLPEREMQQIRGARLAMIFQDPSSALNPVYTILDQLLEVVENHLGIFGDEAIQYILTTLKDVGIASPEQRVLEYPHQMSGGMRQRMMIAMALLCRPDILIADEPTTALDVTIQAQVLDLIRKLQRERGMALLLITHDIGVVAEMADDVIVMYAGQAVEKASCLDLFEKPLHPYTQGLFASRPHLQDREKHLLAIKGSVPSLGFYPTGCRFHPRCPYVMPKCRHGTVPLFLAEHEHKAGCWLLESSYPELIDERVGNAN